MKLPLPPSKVLKLFGSELSEYEQTEILDYKQIYFIGLKAEKIKGSLLEDNFGYDDDEGNYNAVLKDHIAYRYEITSTLGSGSFG